MNRPFPPVIVVETIPADMATKKLAATLFPRLQRSQKLGEGKIREKQAEWADIYAGMTQAEQHGGCLRVPCGNRDSVSLDLRRQVVNAAEDAQILKCLPRASANVRKQYVPGKHFK